MTIKNLAVYCGASDGNKPIYLESADKLGREMARRGIGLVYGGGGIGMMGAVARGVLAAGGDVIGVIPRALHTKEVALYEATEMIVVDTMHERKAKMIDLADGFVILPGGLGTLEELFEVWTWNQLRFIDYPIGLLNTAGYFDSMLTFVRHQIDEGFVRSANLDLVQVEESPMQLLDQLQKA